jgi:hypothetical protein
MAQLLILWAFKLRTSSNAWCTGGMAGAVTSHPNSPNLVNLKFPWLSLDRIIFYITIHELDNQVSYRRHLTDIYIPYSIILSSSGNTPAPPSLGHRALMHLILWHKGAQMTGSEFTHIPPITT